MAEHAAPYESMECMACMEDIEESNYAEYQSEEGGAWKPALFCTDCIGHLLNSQWNKYVDGLGKATCKAEQTRLLAGGPPVNLKDNNALACPDGGEVHSLWYMHDKQVHSAKLEGSLEGDERQAWWDEKLAFQFDEPDEPAEGGSDSTPGPEPPG